MAIAFEMQVEFDGDRSLRKQFLDAAGQIFVPIMINGKKIEFHTPGNTFVTIPADAWTNISITPKNVGHGVSFDTGDFIALNKHEMLELSLHMYYCLKDVPGYVYALVGWELDNITSTVKSYMKSPAYVPEGLVIHKNKADKFKQHGQVEFDRAHV